MARQINAPIRVFLDQAQGAPLTFLWEERRYRVCCVDACWKQVGSWWDGEGERTFFRVSTEEGIYDLAYDHASGRWSLANILD